MIPSLPTELVREIVLSSVTHTFDSETYPERQKTLCSLSLVSKLFHSIAQPLLSEIVWLKSAEKIEACATGGGGPQNQVGIRWAVIGSIFAFKGHMRFQKEQVEAALRRFESAEILTFEAYSEEAVDLSLLSSFQHLSTLHLSRSDCTLNRSLSLPSLRSLTLDCVNPDVVIALLDPVSLPNLEEFALADINAEWAEPLQESALDQLLPQLRALFFNFKVWEDPNSTFLHSFASRTLVDCWYYDLDGIINSTLPVVHLRFYGQSHDDEDDDDDDYDYHENGGFWGIIERFTSHIQASPSLPLRSIYLEHSLLDSIEDERYQDLSRLCQQRKIEIVDEPGPTYLFFHSCISPEFSRRQKDLMSAGIDVEK